VHLAIILDPAEVVCQVLSASSQMRKGLGASPGVVLLFLPTRVSLRGLTRDEGKARLLSSIAQGYYARRNNVNVHS
jgi:hypothetical protein